MVDFVVEDGVPLPGEYRRGRRRGGFCEALRQLSVGQSVFRKNVNHRTVNGSLVRIKGEDRSKTFVSRTVDGGVRVWRVA